MSKIEFLDHVAIQVVDPENSAQWYAETLGLERYQPEEWKPVPIMMFAANSGLALFKVRAPLPDGFHAALHIAFRIPADALDDWQKRLAQAGIAFTVQDHVHFRSVYFNDPDGYRLELTAPVLQEQ